MSENGHIKEKNTIKISLGLLIRCYDTKFVLEEVDFVETIKCSHGSEIINKTDYSTRL